jgi:hypothetical protein
VKNIEETIKKNKKLILFLVLAIISILVVLSRCSKDEKDKFVGTWYRDGFKDAVITEKDGKYTYQTYSESDGKVEKGALYKDGYIEEGYLIYDYRYNTCNAFEYKNDNEIMRVTFFRTKHNMKLSEAEKEEDWTLKRSKDD